MSRIAPLPPDALCQRCDSDRFPFTTTATLEQLPGIIGQARAVKAIRFGIGIRNPGYNIYAQGPSGVGKNAAVQSLLEMQPQADCELSDWCYVNNFKQPSRPKLLKLPSGCGSKLRDDMLRLVEELRAAIPAAFQHNEYLIPLRRIEDEFEKRQYQAFTTLGQEAERHHIKLIQQKRPEQFTFGLLKDDHLISAEEYEKLPEDERKRFESEVSVLQEQLQEILDIRIPEWQRESRSRVRELNRKTTANAVHHIIDSLKQAYADLPQIGHYLEKVEQDVIDNADAFRKPSENENPEQELLTPGTLPRRYRINLLVDNADSNQAPVIYEDSPSFVALLGRIEHTVQFGTLITDFTQIRAGALQRANGGYLILDAHRLLSQPYAWDGLKRALIAREIHIESLAELLGLVNTVSLTPEALPLDVKLILLGDRLLYHLLHEFDPRDAALDHFHRAIAWHIEIAHHPQRGTHPFVPVLVVGLGS